MTFLWVIIIGAISKRPAFDNRRKTIVSCKALGKSPLTEQKNDHEP